MAVRDRVVLWVLGCGAPGTLLAWRLLGPWPGMLLLIATLLVAALAYRIEPPRIDLSGTPTFLDDDDDREVVPEPRSEAIDQ